MVVAESASSFGATFPDAADNGIEALATSFLIGGSADTEYILVFKLMIESPFLTQLAACIMQPHPFGPSSGSMVISPQPFVSRQTLAHSSIDWAP